jgi:hypothetical protein
MKWLACFLMLLLAPTAALAQVGTASPYTFTVPLQLENLPETTQVRVTCDVSRIAAGATGALSNENVVAHGETTVSVTGGRYNADVTVPTTWRRAGATGASYQCGYTLMGPQAGGGTFAANSAGAYTSATGRRVTSSVTWSEGPIS